jgi:hemerythrin
MTNGLEGGLREIAEKAGWSKVYDTGMPEIDYQHMQLFLMIERLSATSGAIAVSGVLGELAGYVKFHFGLEERLMELHGYPMLENHKLKHVALVNQVGLFGERLENGENVAVELRKVLREWLFKHISGDDQIFASHVAKGQLKADSNALADWKRDVATQENERTQKGGLLSMIKGLFSGRK